METKVCSKCQGEPQPIENFAFKNKEKGWRHSYCKKCMNEVNRLLYHSSEKRKQDVRKFTYGLIEKIRIYIKEYKENIGCTNCKIKYPSYVLDFHHIDDKKEQISQMVSSGNLKRIKEEIEKCIVVCANCHREIHHGNDDVPNIGTGISLQN